jgi:hypothetical protein
MLLTLLTWPRPGRSSADELPLSCVERNASLVEVVERETSGATATDADATIFFGVVAGMAAALRLHALSELQLVSELQHGLLQVAEGPLLAPTAG